MSTVYIEALTPHSIVVFDRKWRVAPFADDSKVIITIFTVEELSGMPTVVKTHTTMASVLMSGELYIKTQEHPLWNTQSMIVRYGDIMNPCVYA